MYRNVISPASISGSPASDQPSCHQTDALTAALATGRHMCGRDFEQAAARWGAMKSAARLQQILAALMLILLSAQNIRIWRSAS